MVKAYLRYEQASSFGVITSLESNISYDSTGEHVFAPALEKVGIWHVRQGICSKTLVPSSSHVGKSLAVTSIASSASTSVAVGYADGSIRIWDSEKGTCETTLDGHKGAVTALRYNKAGSMFASGSKDNDVILWDVVGETGIFRLHGHRDQVTDLVFLDDGKKLVTASKDKFLRVWDLETQHCVQIISGHHTEVWSVDVDPEEKYLVTGSADQELRFYAVKQNMSNGSLVSDSNAHGFDASDDHLTENKWEVLIPFGEIQRQTKDRVASVRYNASGNLLACQMAEKTIEIFQVLDETEAMRKAKHRLHRKEKKSSKDGVENASNEIEKADTVPTVPDVFKLLQVIRAGRKISSFSFCPIAPKDSLATLALSLNNNSLEFYTIKSSENEKTATIEHQGHRSDVRSVALSADNTLLMSTSHSEVKIWNPSTGSCLRTIDSGYGICSLIVRENKYGIVGTNSGILEIIDIASATKVEDVQAHGGTIWSIAPIPDDTGFVTVSADHEVKFWEYQVENKAGQEAKQLTVSNVRSMKMNDDVLAVAISPDAKHIAVALLDSTVKVFYVDSLKFFLSLYGHKLPVMCIDISSDGALIVTGSQDKNIKIWGLDFGDCHKSIFAHDDSVMGVKFVHNTHYMFSIGKDQLVKYWDAEKFELLLTLGGHHAEIWCFAVSNCGDFLVTGSHDRSMRRWDRTEESFFLEEEKEKRLEKLFESEIDNAAENRHGNCVVAIDKGELQEEEASAVARFYKIILGWDYKQLTKENERKNKKDTKRKLSVVKNTYKDVDDYFETFEPLLLEEVKAQILQNQDGEEASVCKMRLVMECSEADGFHILLVTYEHNEDEYLNQNDLLLLSKEEVKGSSFPSSYGFAVVENRQSNLLRLRMYLAEDVVQITKNTNSSRTKPFIQSLSNMRSLITSSASPLDKRVFSLKLCGLSTIIREYIALRSISLLPFKDLIFTAAEKSCGFGDDAWKISGPLHEFFSENLNKSQNEAIDVGLSRRSFVLIQGPPGTGKTQTILSILGAIMHATPARVQSKEHELKRRVQMTIEDKYNHWSRASPWILGVNPRDAIMPEDGDDGFFPTSGNDMKPEVVNANRKYRIRVLVCAPSNSALDEIVLRLLTAGLRDENAQTYTPKIVRIGLKAHHSVTSVWLDHLEKQKRGSAIDKPKQGTTGTDVDSIRTSILDEAAIVFSTLSSSGSQLLAKSNRGFDVVIIDEAAQAVEPATLIPLATRCKQVFLVGDPKQLPATVISTVAQDSGYGTSMFERLQKAGYPVNMLKTQYRMHPEIRSFPSKEFYEEALEDGADIEAQTTRDWHKYRCFGPFCFFDIHEGKESQHPGATGSRVNLDEVEFVLLIYHKLVTMYPELKSSSQLAIISPYNYQVKTFKDRFEEMFGTEAEKVVDINTVDGFQGREKDVAIFSCVRANDKGEIGFLSNSRRMNVGITRAKSSVLVVGSAATLKCNPLWKNLVESAENRNRLFKVSKPMIDFFSEENMETMKVTEDMEIPDGPGFEDEAPLVANYGGDDDNDFGDGDQDDAVFAEED